MTSLLPQLSHSQRYVVSAFLVSLLISGLVVAARGVPAPKIQDEFAYLLGADTFASGRVTNPTHPLWQHFESIHVIHQPSYNAKYPPLQSLTLAIGQSLGHPFVGVALATATSIAALVWMLIGWLPRRVHGLTWLVVTLHPGFHTYWGHSYWGGAIAMLGASLLLGSFIRACREMRWHYGLIAGIGIVMLANSRPFEGAVLTASVTIGLLIKLAIDRQWTLQPFCRRLVLPAGAVLLAGFVTMGWYNQQVTGNPIKMPYQVHEETYAWNPVFVWQTAGPEPEYRHRDIRNFFAFDKQTTERAFPDLSSVLANKSKVVVGLFDYFCGPLILLAVLAGILQPSLWSDRRTWAVLGLLMPVLLASIASKWANFHYAAPAAPLMLLVALGGVAGLVRQFETRPSMIRIGTWSLIAFQLVWAMAVLKETHRQDNDNWGDQRVAMIQQLESEPGKDLVLVRYSDDHHQHHEWIEWVYNRADIDNAEVVWARELDPIADASLRNYFADRNIWVLEADVEPIQLTPFSAAEFSITGKESETDPQLANDH